MSYPEVELQHICVKDGMVDGPFGSNLPASDYTSWGIPVIRGVNLSLGEYQFSESDYVFVAEHTADRLKRSNCRADDIIFTKKGTLGQVGIVPKFSEHKRFLLSSNQMRARLDTKIADPLYVFYFVSSPYGRRRVQLDAMTSGVPKINLTYLRRFKVLLPPLPTQKKIASILSAYDDLIENNKRRIALLEKMAEEIYREWFVRMRFSSFAEASDDKPEMDKGLPVGWESKDSTEVLDVLSGGTPKTEVARFWDGGIPFFTPKDAPDSIYVFDTEKKISHEGLQSCSSALYPRNTIFITARGTVGKICLAQTDMAMNQSCYALRPKDVDLEVYFFFLSMKNAVTYLKGVSKSGVFDNIIKDTFKIIPLLIPPKEDIQKFNSIVSPHFELIDNLLQQNRSLVTVRDLLLPRLISGKLSVEKISLDPVETAEQMTLQSVEALHA